MIEGQRLQQRNEITFRMVLVNAASCSLSTRGAARSCWSLVDEAGNRSGWYRHAIPAVHTAGVPAIGYATLWDLAAGCAGAGVAGLRCVVAYSAVRLRLLRAAWRPCPRGPDRRAAVVGAANGSEPRGMPRSA